MARGNAVAFKQWTLLCCGATAFVLMAVNYSVFRSLSQAAHEMEPATAMHSGEEETNPVAQAQAIEQQIQRKVTSTKESSQRSQLLVVTGYWKMKSKRGNADASDKLYSSCMNKVLSLNTPIAVFGDNVGLQKLQMARGSLTFASTSKVAIEDMEPCVSARNVLNSSRFIHRMHVPNIVLGCLWDAKMDMLRRAAATHIGYKWYAWLDACMGHGAVRFNHDDTPWPTMAALQKLPSDKVTVSYSHQRTCEKCRGDWHYCHCIAGTAFVVPATLVEKVAQKFYKKVRECLDSFADSSEGGYMCFSDQVIFTKLFLEEPALFFFTSQGYGAVATLFLTAKK